MNLSPHPTLLLDFKNNNHPLSVCEIFEKKGLQLVKFEFERCKEFYLEFGSDVNSPVNLFYSIFQINTKIDNFEFNSKHRLSLLANDVVRQFFNVKNQVDLKSQITSSVNYKSDYDKPKKNVDVDKLKSHIQKKIVLNAITHGAAIHLWKSLCFLAEDKLNDIDSRLLPLYNNFIADSSISFWVNPSITTLPKEHVNKKARKDFAYGQNQIVFNNPDSPQIFAEALNFPGLLHELVKGIVDLIMLHGLDESLSQDEQHYVFYEADNHLHEYWHYYLGPGLWQSIIHQVKKNEDIPDFLMNLAKQDYKKLNVSLLKIIEDYEQSYKRTRS